VLILIKAYDDTFAQTVQARYSYRHDEFVWGRKFAPAFSIDSGGELVVDLNKIGDIDIAG
jgi:inward rectifier potassium channel